MAEPHPLHEQIAQAWEDLTAARNAWSRSPNSHTIRDEIYAETRLNRLLERRLASSKMRAETLAY